MSVADTFKDLIDDREDIMQAISDCYDEVQSKGGTIPQNKNTNNLATAIGSIPSGLRLATGTFTPTDNSLSVIVDWNLDFVPVVAFCKIADGSEPDTIGIDGAFSIKGGTLLPYSTDEHFVVENSVGSYSLQSAMTIDPLLSQTQWKMTYRSARYKWRKGVTYRWYAIEGAEE